jgi:hypothetical protein
MAITVIILAITNLHIARVVVPIMVITVPFTGAHPIAIHASEPFIHLTPSQLLSWPSQISVLPG